MGKLLIEIYIQRPFRILMVYFNTPNWRDNFHVAVSSLFKQAFEGYKICFDVQHTDMNQRR